MGAQKSRLAKAGSDRNAAIQSLVQEYESGASGWSPAQIAAFENPATRDAWLNRQIGQSTKGKFSGTLGAIGKAVTKVAPYALPLIPGVGTLAAGLGSAAIGKLGGKSLKASLLQGAGSAAGSALLGGKGFKGFGDVTKNLGRLAKTGVGRTIGKTFQTAQGGIDLGKLAGVGMGVAQIGGARAQRKSAERSNQAQQDVRNRLISRLLERPQYNFNPEP